MAIIKPIESSTLFNTLFDDYGKQVWEKVRNGAKVLWTTSLAPYEIFDIFGFAVVIPEIYIGGTRPDLNADLCMKADNLGLSTDLCGIIRSFTGYKLSDSKDIPYEKELPWGGAPSPDILLTHYYCPAVSNTWKIFAKRYNAPLLTYERLFVHDSYSQSEIDALLDNSVNELKELISYLESYTGKKMDWDKLEEMTDNEIEASKIWSECLDLLQHKPAPMCYFDFINYALPFQLFKGNPEIVKKLKIVKAELEDRIAKGYVSLTENEKYRLYWDGLPMVHHFAEHRELFAKYNAVPVIGLWPYHFGNQNVKSKDPLRRIAEYLMVPNKINLGPKRRGEFITDICDRWSVDALIMGRTRTCQPVNIGQDDYLEMILKHKNMPYFVFDGDQNDPRLFDADDFEMKFESMMEQLERHS